MIFRYLYLIFAIAIAACSKSPEVFNPADSPYFTTQDQIIAVDGVNVRYRSDGPDNGRPIVFIHGFTSSLETWDELAGSLSNSYRTIRFDLPGHGLTGPDRQARYSNDETAEFVDRLMSEQDIRNPVIIGNSLGGLAAWKYAELRPDNVAALVLISPGGFSINGVTDDPVPVPLMVQMYLQNAPEAGVQAALSALYGDPSALSEARVRTFRDLMLTPGNGQAFVERAANFTLPDPSEKLSNIEMPTLILWGTQDIMVPVSHGEQFAALMPNARLVKYDGAGHVPHEEIPDKVLADIQSFLAELNL